MSRIPASPHLKNAPAPLPVESTTAPSQAAKQRSTGEAATPARPSAEAPTPSDHIALEKQGGSMNHYNLGLDATAATASTSTTDPVTKVELQWALELEDKVVKGYQPSAQEFDKYADIAARLADCNPARQMEGSDEPEVKGPQKTESGTVSDAEIKWALRLEERVMKGYQPSAEEVAAYEAIYTQMTAQKDVPSDLPEKDLKWAQELMEKIEQGYQPTAQEVKRYEAIYNTAQEAIQSQEKPSENTDTQWAKALQSKVLQGYQPTAAEVKRYEEIYDQLQQAKQVKQ